MSRSISDGVATVLQVGRPENSASIPIRGEDFIRLQRVQIFLVRTQPPTAGQSGRGFMLANHQRLVQRLEK